MNQRRFGSREYLTDSAIAAAGLRASFANDCSQFDRVELALDSPESIEGG